jgi:hypothetical protein
MHAYAAALLSHPPDEATIQLPFVVVMQFILDDSVLERINRLDLFVDNWRSQLAQQAAAAKEAKAAHEAAAAEAAAAAASGGHEHHRHGYHSAENRAQRARQRHAQHATTAAAGQVRRPLLAAQSCSIALSVMLVLSRAPDDHS